MAAVSKSESQSVAVTSQTTTATTSSTEPTQRTEPSMTFLQVALGVAPPAAEQVLLTPSLAHSLIQASGDSLVSSAFIKQDQAQQFIESSQAEIDAAAATPTSATATVLELPDANDVALNGCARTDYHRNHLLSVKVKNRRQLLKQKAAQGGFDLASFQGKLFIQRSSALGFKVTTESLNAHVILTLTYNHLQKLFSVCYL